MGVSKLTILGFAILAWGGAVGLAAPSLGASFVTPAGVVAVLAATAGLAIAIVGAARHDAL
jgi:hypothetical protein